MHSADLCILIKQQDVPISFRAEAEHYKKFPTIGKITLLDLHQGVIFCVGYSRRIK